MRKYVIDGHTHTIACNHAYNTITELAVAAKAAGLQLFCVTEHGPAIPGAPGDLFFSNYRIIPGEINGVKLLKGVEANIMDVEGNLDIPQKALKLNRLEIISASLHSPCFSPSTKPKNTSAVIGAINNPHVDFICHLGNPEYELDYEAILQEAKKTNTMIEINNGSFFIRKGSKDNCVAIAKRCAELEIPIIVGSDTHFCSDIGYFPYADKALTLAGVPDELIVNLEVKRLTDYLEAKGRELFKNPRDAAEKEFSEVL